MRAAVLRGHASVPALEQWQPPVWARGESLIELRAAPLTPLDLLCASGTSYFGAPSLPYVPGVQGVGLVLKSDTIAAGAMAWFSTSEGMGPGDGSLREVCSVPDADVVPLSFHVAPERVAALGLSAVAAWMAVTWRGELHEGEQVIVLGAGGAVGQVAGQGGPLRGARRVIAGCRGLGAGGAGGRVALGVAGWGGARRIIAGGRAPAAADRARRCGADAVVRL